MLIPGLNQLAEPEIVKVEAFEPLLAEFKAEVVAYVAARDPAKAARLEEALDNDSDLLAMMLQAFTLRLQGHERKYNARIKQMLAWWAEGSNLDARLADMGLERRVISAGDPSAFPPVPAELEPDDEARVRYYLAPHAPAAGSRLHYRREALTLGERAAVSVAAPSPGTVVVTYTMGSDALPAQIKDVNAVRVTPGVVRVWVLARAGRGTPPELLLQGIRAHFAREDVVPETDTVEVAAAEIIEYRIRARAYINPGPDAGITQRTATASLEEYTAGEHRLKGYVDPDHIKARLIGAGAQRIELIEPVTPIVCSDGQAPYCAAVDVTIEVL